MSECSPSIFYTRAELNSEMTNGRFCKEKRKKREKRVFLVANRIFFLQTFKFPIFQSIRH